MTGRLRPGPGRPDLEWFRRAWPLISLEYLVEMRLNHSA